MSRWRARLSAALALGILGIVLAPTTAFAHAELASSTPAPNATLKQAPTVLVLAFTEPVDPANSSIELLDETGQSLPGVQRPSAGDGNRRLTAALPTLTPGIYEVSYRVTSAVDGHVTTGLFAFRFDPTGTLPPPAGTATTASPSVDLATIAARWAALVLLLLLVGTSLFWVVAALPSLADTSSGHADFSPIGHARLVWAALALISVGTVLALLAFLSLSAAAIGTSGGQSRPSFPLDPVAAFGWTPFAVAMRVALLGCVAACAVAVARLLLPRPRRGAIAPKGEARFLIAALVPATLALGGLSFAGHASANGGPFFAAIDTLHLVAVAAWLGTLGGLALLAWMTRGVVGRGAILGSALARHSRIALVAAPVVAISGLANSPVVIGQVRQVVGSDYGNLVIAKAALFSVAVAIGSANFFLVRRRSFAGVALLVGGEALVGLIAVAAAATMLTIQPGASRVPLLSQSAIQTAHVFLTAGSLQVHAAIDIPAPGDQLYQVAVADANGQPSTDVEHILLDFRPPAGSGLAARPVALARTVDPTIWAVQGAYTPALGDWTIGVVIQRAGRTDETTTFPLLVQTPIPPQLVPPPDTGIGVPGVLAILWLLPVGLAGWALPGVALLGAAGLWLLGTRLGWRSSRLARGVRVARLGLVVVALLMVLGVGSRAVVEAANRPTADQPNPLPATADSVARGRLIYLANCSSCHGTDGGGNGPQAAGMLPAPGAVGSAVAGLDDGELQSLVTNGVAGTQMPSFATRLSENERWDLVNYLHARWPQ